jgi:hypothetical protein
MDYLEDVVADGEVVRIPTYVMDTAARDAVRSARARWIKQMCDAYKTPQQRAAQHRDVEPTGNFTCPRCHGTGNNPYGPGDCEECGGEGYIQKPGNAVSKEPHEVYPLTKRGDPRLRVDAQADARAAAKASYYEMRARLQDAWRTRDAAEPDAGTRLLRGAPDPGDPIKQGQAERDRVYQEYKRSLDYRNQGRTDPHAATAIERQGEQWRHGK